MSLFDKNMNYSPVTAQLLRDIIERRRVGDDNSDEERYERILDRIYKIVEYSVSEDVYSHEISLSAIGCTCPWCSEFIKEINEKISNKVGYDKLCEFIHSRIEELTRDELWDKRLLKFADYFKSRGFDIICNWRQYIKLLDQESRVSTKIIKISWE